MSFHFTQFCAFIAYLFRFMGYYLCFYRGKDRHFFKGARDFDSFFLCMGDLTGQQRVHQFVQYNIHWNLPFSPLYFKNIAL